MSNSRTGTVIDEHGNFTTNSQKISFGEALKLYLKGANKLHLLGVGRVLLLILAGYAPFAALNDALAPFLLGLPIIDDLEIPFGIIAMIKIYIDVNRYRSPGYRRN